MALDWVDFTLFLSDRFFNDFDICAGGDGSGVEHAPPIAADDDGPSVYVSVAKHTYD